MLAVYRQEAYGWLRGVPRRLTFVAMCDNA
jgi:hypothetical protein